MSTKKEGKKSGSSSCSSSSSNSSSSSSSSDSDTSSPQISGERRNQKNRPEAKGNSRERSPQQLLNRNIKSKWDSPDDRAGGRRRQVWQSNRRGNSRHLLWEHMKESSSGRRDTTPRKSNTYDHRQDNRRNDGNKCIDSSGDRRHNRKDNNSTHYKRKQEHTRRENTRERNKRHRSKSPNRANFKRRNRSRSISFDHANAVWGKSEHKEKLSTEPPKEKEKPNYGLSGKLTEETNTYKGVVIKYSEPPEARKPKRRWRLYPFKGEKAMQTLYIHRESAYLIGRDRKVVDLPVDHPSCSKQHAAIQYRLVQFTRENGSVGKRVRPYLIDLDSANGTYINNKKIEPRQYVELLERDVIKFGYSSREYVLLHENSKDEAQDDDVTEEVHPEANSIDD